MRWAQRLTDLPSTKQEIVTYPAEESGKCIADTTARFTVKVVSMTYDGCGHVIVVYEEDNR